MNLRLRLTCAAAFLLGVIALLGVVLDVSLGSSELRQVDQQLQHSSVVVRTLDAPPSTPQHPHANKKKFLDARFSGFYIATVTDGHRRVVVTPLDAGQSSPRMPPAVSTPGHAPKLFTVGSISGSLEWRVILVAKPHSTTHLLVGVSLAAFNATMNTLRFALFLAGLVIFAVVVATGVWVAQLGLRPIAEVTDAADAITAGDRTRRVSIVRQRTEAGKLAQAFNLMLDEQFAMETRLRQFVADASHELRTPVAVIIGITELWRKGEIRSEEERDEAVRRLGTSSKQIGGLVEDLLLLARLDEGRPMEWTPVNLSQLVEDVVADTLINHPERSITVHVAELAVVDGDAEALRRVVNNVISNALHHTSPHAVVEVHLSHNEVHVCLDVDDSGPGMTPDEVSHAFDRFWQGDAARSRSGSGLGLAIVRSIVLAHSGEVTLESSSQTGTHVRVVIPRERTFQSDHESLAPSTIT